MEINLKEVIRDAGVLAQGYIVREGFVFTAITHPSNIFDAIIVRQPHDARCLVFNAGCSKHDLKAQIDFINEYKIEKAVLIADDIGFITKCPCLKHLRIIPADNTVGEFDYSPLYHMPNIKSLQCSTSYGFRGERKTSIDYANIKGIESIAVGEQGHKNIKNVNTLKSLGISDFKDVDLTNMFNSLCLDTLTIIKSKIKSLEGLQKSLNLQCLYLYYNRNLQDIAALRGVNKTLKALRIENCPRIEDFSVLKDMENLQLLELSGNNKLSSLDFLKNIRELKTFIFSMEVLDGDLSPCLDLSYVYCEKNRKHYNLKDCDLPKGIYIRGNESIEEWRRAE